MAVRRKAEEPTFEKEAEAQKYNWTPEPTQSAEQIGFKLA
jgi:hypothetical protein